MKEKMKAKNKRTIMMTKSHATQSSVPIQNQMLLLDGRPLSDNRASLASCGCKDGDVLLLHSQNPSQVAGNTRTLSSATHAQSARHPVFGEYTPEAVLEFLANNPTSMSNIRQRNPALYDSIIQRNVPQFERLYTEMTMEIEKSRRENEERIARLERDPLDPEAQRQIEEEIRMRNVLENMEQAIEYTPEVFGSVTMLYINCQVNGVPVKAFVDSGAQSTIMSIQCAERCGIMRLVDKRFAGTAVGVGQSKIIGRVHMAQMKIGNSFFASSFTILENINTDFLLGLDMLKKHSCTIDLKRNLLVIGNEEVTFLPEKDIPGGAHPRGADATISPPSQTQRIPASASAPSQAQPASQPTLSSSTIAQSPARPTAQAANPSPWMPASQHSQPQSSPALGPSRSSPSVNEAHVKTLMDLGFSRAEVLRALQLANGNVELAASFLYSLP
eukprot:TRINITY_DN2101_c0_g1_i2.p1 TRINITY_DN2101_c0_g1~~TRINITY_DN2101_c0_g1_i2.p1  ORF type:complete len:454 (+),score=109.63 TRINITY_DN2101_c0_g1_i2:31-1362(+)